MGADGDLDAVVRAARVATHELLGMLVAHRMVPGILNLHLVPEWPAPVRDAYLHWADRIDGVARVLAGRRGIEPGEGDTTGLIIRACILGLGLDE